MPRKLKPLKVTEWGSRLRRERVEIFLDRNNLDFYAEYDGLEHRHETAAGVRKSLQEAEDTALEEGMHDFQPEPVLVIEPLNYSGFVPMDATPFRVRSGYLIRGIDGKARLANSRPPKPLDPRDIASSGLVRLYNGGSFARDIDRDEITLPHIDRVDGQSSTRDRFNLVIAPYDEEHQELLTRLQDHAAQQRNLFERSVQAIREAAMASAEDIHFFLERVRQ